DPALGIELTQERRATGPGPVRIEGGMARGNVRVVAIKQAAQHLRAAGIVEKDGELSSAADAMMNRPAHGCERACYISMEAWILPQQSREQSGARAGQAGDEMNRFEHGGSVLFESYCVPRAPALYAALAPESVRGYRSAQGLSEPNPRVRAPRS